LKDAYQKEHGIARYTLENLIKNISLAQQKMRPVCQDTGAAVFFVDIGEDVFVQGSIKSAINRAVSRAYTDFLSSKVNGEKSNRKREHRRQHTRNHSL